MTRWMMVMGLVIALAGCGGPAAAESPLDAWAQAVAEGDAAGAAAFMQTPPDDWAFQVSKVHREPVTGYRIAKPLAPASDGASGEVATVVWERQSDDPVLRYACIRTVRVLDDRIVVKRDSVGLCDADGNQ